MIMCVYVCLCMFMSLRDPEGPARGGVGPIVSFKTETTEPSTRSEIFFGYFLDLCRLSHCVKDR